jgi:hypothetical protein
MSTPVRASDRDLRALAAIVSQDRTDLPDGEGLPPSLLADLMGQIRCDALGLDGWDSGRQMCWFSQEIPSGDAAIDFEPTDQVFWETTGTASTAAMLPALATSAASYRSRTSTRPGNGTARPCTPIATGCWAWSTISWCACLARCRQPPGLGGMCG